MAYFVRKKLVSLGKTIFQSTHIPTTNPNCLAATPSTRRFLTSSPIFRARNDVDHSNKHSDAQCSSATPGLVGWWVGISEEAKCPYGHIIHISAEHGKYLARSYSPWQLATAKNGTPVFEIYVTTGLQGEYKEQAIYIKHTEACRYSLESLQSKQAADMCMFPLAAPGFKTEQERWAESMMKLEAATEKDVDKEIYETIVANNRPNQGFTRNEEPEAAVDSLKEKTVIYIAFAVGDILEKNSGNLNKKLLRVPSILERKGCSSFCLMLEEDKDQHVSSDCSHEVYRTTDHGFLHVIDCIGRGIPMKEVLALLKEEIKNFIPLLLSRAQNQQPLLSRLTTFNRIDVPTSFDPLNGLYIGSNGYLATEVIQIRNVFGPWHEVGGMKDVLEPELCEYVEAVNLTGDFDMPAGQVAFRAKVDEKYKLRPGIVLEAKYGAVARYKGKGRHPGFQNSEWVDVEVVILGEEYRRSTGFAVAVLYSASEYYFTKFFKQLKLQSFQESH